MTAARLDRRIHQLLTERRQWMPVDDIADLLDVPPRKVLQALQRAGGGMFQVRTEDRGAFDGGLRNLWAAVGIDHPDDPPPPATKERTMSVPRVQPDETWADYAARAVGLDREQPCRHCDGTGLVQSRVTITAVIQTIKGSTSGMSAADFARWCANPRLEDLQRIAGLLADAGEVASLDAAAQFLGRLARLVEDQP